MMCTKRLYKQLRKGFQITPYAIKDKEGKRVGKDNIAEGIAKHLANNTRNNKEAEGTEPTMSTRQIVEMYAENNLEEPSIRKMKRVIQ